MLILASASPRRQELLRQIGCHKFSIQPAAIDETAYAKERPVPYALRLAETKAQTIAAQMPQRFVLAADTVVAVGHRILGKAQDTTMAREYLELLSGRQHRVTTAICLFRPDGTRALAEVTTRLRFKRLQAQEIDRYIAGDEWRDKAGAYAIQGLAGAWVDKMQGCYFNVVGLPIGKVHRWLITAGLLS